MQLPTDEEARAQERRVTARIDADRHDGWKQCPGYPFEHYCLALIPWTRSLCTFCAGTRALEQRRLAMASTAIPSAAEILADLPIPDRPTIACPCGGILDAPMHTESLTHILWLRGDHD